MGLRDYLEFTYSITGPAKIDDALGLCSHKNTFNDVQSYLKSLVWDGIKRLDTLLIDYLGAEDNTYVRNVTRKPLQQRYSNSASPCREWGGYYSYATSTTETIQSLVTILRH